jgi:predicted esterase
MKSLSVSYGGIALGLLIASVSGPSHAQVRFEVRPVESMTLSSQQFLTGDKNGKPVTLAGELRIPKPGTDKLAAVILVHGSGGIGLLHERWVKEINGVGVATFVLDHFSGRGIIDTNNDQSQLSSLAMMVDSYRALAELAQHPRIDSNRIAVMGFSKGAIAAIYSSNERFRKLYGPSNIEFSGHIGLYTPCDVVYHDDDKVTGKPIRLFHGIDDDWVSIGPCRDYVQRLKKAGMDATLSEYPGATHAYDAFMLKEPMKFPQAQTIRNCHLSEGDAGQIINDKTGRSFSFDDPCLERGTTVAYNEEATTATTKAVKEFLTTVPTVKN